MDKTVPEGVTSVYNPWHAVALVLENAKTHFDKERADQILKYTSQLPKNCNLMVMPYQQRQFANRKEKKYEYF